MDIEDILEEEKFSLKNTEIKNQRINYRNDIETSDRTKDHYRLKGSGRKSDSKDIMKYYQFY